MKQIEMKYLIELPDMIKLTQKYRVEKTLIDQTYLVSAEGCERRVRSETMPYGDGDYIARFSYGTKIPADNTGLSREHYVEKIDYHLYILLLKEADKQLETLKKVRYTFSINEQEFKLDIYPFEKKLAILEIPLASDDAAFELPEGITVVMDVTSDERYKNRSLAQSLTFPYPA